MATITIKQTPLYLKNGKVGFILEENQYEFCDGVWDIIKSYMGFQIIPNFRKDPVSYSGFDPKFRLHLMINVAERTNDVLYYCNWSKLSQYNHDEHLRKLNFRVCREVKKKYSIYNPFANLEQMLLLANNKIYKEDVGFTLASVSASVKKKDRNEPNGSSSYKNMTIKQIEYVENDLYNLYINTR